MKFKMSGEFPSAATGGASTFSTDRARADLNKPIPGWPFPPQGYKVKQDMFQTALDRAGGNENLRMADFCANEKKKKG